MYTGYKFLVMEKMKGPLWDAVPALLQKEALSSNGKIPIGPIAEQLLTCIELLHEKKQLVVDVKPENFMIAHSDCRGRTVQFADKNAKVAEQIARKVRILDLALVTPYRVADGHRPDEGISEMVGTPLYASLNVHDSHTPSRRDDIEALFYVISELIVRIVAAANGDTKQYESNTEMPSYLPWSHGTSDEAIGEMKKKEVSNLNSEFYKRMGDKTTAKSMKEYFDLVRQINYKEAPDYKAFRNIISNLVVSVEVQKKKAATKNSVKSKVKASPAKASVAATSRATSSSRAERLAKRNSNRMRTEESDSEEEDSPTKHRKTIKEEDFEDAEEPPEDMDVEILEVSDDSSDDETCYHDTQEEMDWEPVPKENHQPDKEKKKKPRVGLEIHIVEGPHVGESFTLINGETDAVVIGRKPKATNKQCEVIFRLAKDPDVDSTHTRLDLKASKQVCSVKVSDLKSKTGTMIGSKALSKGGNSQAFINDKFTIGQSTFRVVALSSLSPPMPKKPVSKAETKVKAKTAPLSQKKPAKSASTDDKANAESTTADIVVQVVDGPYKGESFVLEKGNVEIINLGSSRSVAKKGDPIVLSNDKGVEKRHARLELVKSKQVTKVKVTDLSESTGTYVDGRQIAAKKDQMCFIGQKVKIGSTVLELKSS